MKSYFTLIILLACMVSFQLSAQWTPVSSPPENFLTDHTIGVSANGKGYLIAGTDELGFVRNDVYEYDPITDAFTKKSNFPGGARGFSIGDSWNGKAYVGFGLNAVGSLLNDLWEYDAENDEWNQLARCPCPARLHPAFIAHNDKIYVGLGSSNSSNLNDWWIYDLTLGSWSQGARFPAQQRHHPYQFAIGDYIYAGFGHGSSIFNDWYRYDPANDTWDQMASLPAQGRVAGQQFSFNGKGYVLSGEDEAHDTMDEGEFWSYDPDLDEWEAMPSHPGNSRWAPASFVIDSDVYLFNGIVRGLGPSVSVEEAYKYTFDEDVMSSVSTLENNDKISLYPNPVSNQLNIDGTNEFQGELSITDLLGRTILSFDFENQKSIDTSSLSDGVYILKATDGTIAKQFVIAR